jgi:hypothetical protein
MIKKRLHVSLYRQLLKWTLNDDVKRCKSFLNISIEKLGIQSYISILQGKTNSSNKSNNNNINFLEYRGNNVPVISHDFLR